MECIQHTYVINLNTYVKIRVFITSVQLPVIDYDEYKKFIELLIDNFIN